MEERIVEKSGGAFLFGAVRKAGGEHGILCVQR